MSFDRINWQEHCPFVLRCENSHQLLTAIGALMGLNPRTCFAVVGDELQIATTERGIGAINAALFPPPPSWEQQLAAVRSGEGRYRNGHELQAVTRSSTKPCWRIEHLARIRHKLADDPEALAKWDGVSNSDNPHGLIHDETCTTCKGKNVQPDTITVGWMCRMCEQRFAEQHLFDASSCLVTYAADLYAGVTLGIIQEWAEEHDEDGHHYNVPGCPRCAEGRMRVKAERKNSSASVG